MRVLFHQPQFVWSRDAFRPRCQTPTGYRSAGRTFGARRCSQGTCRLYFTDYTLTGQQSASPFRKAVADRSCCRYWASLGQCWPSLFHQSHFDWEPERFSDAGLAYCQAIRHAAPSVSPSSHDSCHSSFTNYALSSTGMLLGSGCQRSVARNFYRGSQIRKSADENSSEDD